MKNVHLHSGLANTKVGEKWRRDKNEKRVISFRKITR